MRTLLAMLFLVSLTSAAEPYTQKPQVAPSVDRGEAVKPAPNPAPAVGLAGGPVPLWIWGADPDKTYFLRKEFAAAGVTAARLKTSADNHVVLFLNGKQVAASDEWLEPAEADVTKLLKPEGNVLLAEVRNSGGPSGFVFKLAMTTEKNSTKYVVSDETWTASEKKDDKGVAAKKVAKYGDQPWGTVFDGVVAGPGAKLPTNVFQVLPGFQVETIFNVPKKELGSWVCLTTDDKGRLIASDEGSFGLCRITPGKPGTNDEAKVERIEAFFGKDKKRITGAQGLLYASNALYVMCNGGPGSGLYRLRSTKNDDQFDEVVKLKAINGGGEHGPHALRLGPDGKSIYIICGNHTAPPEKFDHSRVPKNWGEDHLLPRRWDAGGHAVGILAPGGYIARTDLDGKTWEIISSGYRNPYDFAFNADGEMFAYDADMEWDMGMPWYRPTRVVHATSGSEFGWRSGTGKWPAYYPDSLPPMLDIGPGSPVGIEFGYGSKFPAKYQKALYLCDWTFGTMYALHLEPSGSTYKATKEEFLSRTPLPLTDVCINPADGAMYFTIGGRGADSALFRVTYTGKEPTEKAEYKDARNAKDRELRKRIESLHTPAADTRGAVIEAWPHLAHQDRFIRYAARVALEHQPVKAWQNRVLTPAEGRPQGLLNGVIALARQGDKAMQAQLIATLDQLSIRTDLLDPEAVVGQPMPASFDSEAGILDLLRAYQLVFIRTGEPDKDTAAKLAKKLDPHFPSKSDLVNRELVQLLVYLKSPTVLDTTLKMLQQPSKPLSADEMQDLLARNRGYGGTIANMLKNAPDLQKLHYAFVLRNVKDGWTLEKWKVYFAFLAEARSKSGGASYQGFINFMENDAFANATDADRLAIEAAGLRKPFKPKELPKAIGPGKAWTTADLIALEPKLKGRNFKAGEKAYAAARCVVCHRFAGYGGATGPDLSQVAGRFGLKDMAEAIIEPSKVVSDQYKASVIRTLDGKTITGRVVNDAGGKLTIVTDPEDSTKIVVVAKDNIESNTASNVSLMPDKLLNEMNEGEVLDLLAYLLSRGDPNHAMFKK